MYSIVLSLLLLVVDGWSLRWRRRKQVNPTQCIEHLFTRVLHDHRGAEECKHFTQAQISTLAHGTVICLCERFAYHIHHAALRSHFASNIAKENWRIQCDWLARRRTVLEARAALQQLGTIGSAKRAADVAVARAKDARRQARHTLEHHLRMLDQIATWRLLTTNLNEHANVVRGVRERVQVWAYHMQDTAQKVAGAAKKVQSGAGDEDDESKDVETQQQQMLIACAAFVAHAAAVVHATETGPARRRSACSAMVVIDLALIVEDSFEYAWAARTVSLLILMSHMLRGSPLQHTTSTTVSIGTQTDAYVEVPRPRVALRRHRLRNRTNQAQASRETKRAPPPIFLNRNITFHRTSDRTSNLNMIHQSYHSASTSG